MKALIMFLVILMAVVHPVSAAVEHPLTQPANYTVYLPNTSMPSAHIPSKFGTETNSDFANNSGAAEIISAGFSHNRHMQVDWATRETLQGVDTIVPTAWDAALDAGIAKATRDGMITTIVIRNSPAWATVTGVAGCSAIKPEFYMEFAQFVERMVTYYEKAPYMVTRYEIGNEVDDTSKPPSTTEVGCWQNPLDYVAMLRVVYPYVKALHPNALILNGGFVSTGAWTQSFIKNGGTNYIDILAYHAYEMIDVNAKLWRGATTSVPSEYMRRYNALRGYLATTSKPNIPIYMNEGSAIASPDLQNYDSVRRIQSYFAAYMAASVVSEDGIEMYGWWASQFAPSAFGAQANYVYTPNTLYAALSFGLHKVYASTPITTIRNANGASIIKLMGADGKEIWLMWNTNGANSTDFTHQFGFTPQAIWDVWGSPVPATSSLFMGDPLRVVWVQPQ